LKHIYNNNYIYRGKLNSLGIRIDDILNINDIEKLPIITKKDFFLDYPYGFYSVDKSEIKRYHASSGTTGKSLIVGFTENDLKLRNKMIAENCISSGITKEDVVQICVGYGMFTGGLGFHEALSSIGCTIVPVSSGNTEKQIFYMKTLKTTVLITSPSYAMHIYEVSKKNGIDITKLNLRMIKVGSELLTENMRKKLQECFGEDVLINQDYGMTECMGPGLGNECIFCNGMHIYDKNFIYELVDPITKESSSTNTGELVITTLNNECFPVIRYATNDIVELDDTKCLCGNNSIRIKKIIGRCDDMMKIKGVKVYISQIEDFILSFTFCTSNYELVLSTKEYIDELTLRVEYSHKLNTDLKSTQTKIKNKEKYLKEKFKGMFGIKINVEILMPNTLKRNNGKVKRIRDLRRQDLLKTTN
jgi:phenylacetate-CoA ligase